MQQKANMANMAAFQSGQMMGYMGQPGVSSMYPTPQIPGQPMLQPSLLPDQQLQQLHQPPQPQNLCMLRLVLGQYPLIMIFNWRDVNIIDTWILVPDINSVTTQSAKQLYDATLILKCSKEFVVQSMLNFTRVHWKLLPCIEYFRYV